MMQLVCICAAICQLVDMLPFFLVSRVIPKKVRESDGPSTYSVARGMPRKSHNCFMADRFSWH